MIYLVEHFYSIQGEGRFIGVPSLFLRFGGCNMRCEGFGCIEKILPDVEIKGCDTIYAVNKEYFLDKWAKISHIDELINIVESYNLPKNIDIVLTGGEPLLYGDDLLFVEFLEYLDNQGFRVCFETNGSIDVDFERYPIYKKCCFALSIKLSNSLESFSKRVKKDTIKHITSNAKESFFKFVLDSEDKSFEFEKEIDEIASYAPKIAVYCMPLGDNKQEIERKTEPLIEFCKRKGFIFSDRLHIRVWDKKRGI